MTCGGCGKMSFRDGAVQAYQSSSAIDNEIIRRVFLETVYIPVQLILPFHPSPGLCPQFPAACPSEARLSIRFGCESQTDLKTSHRMVISRKAFCIILCRLQSTNQQNACALLGVLSFHYLER
jgi:hypothetical protein